MKRTASLIVATAMALLSTAAWSQPAAAPAPAQKPMHETTKVEGTDNVYVFRYGTVQAMFVVTPARSSSSTSG